VSSSPAMIARSTGAGPRQRGKSEGCTLSHKPCSSSDSGISSPYAATTTMSASSATSGPSRSDCITGIPCRSATSFAGGAASLRPRPRGASGRVRSATMSCRTARRSRTSAPNGAVAATAIRAMRSADDDARPQRRQRLAARLRRRAVDHQHAVEVVDLVLHGPGDESLQLERDILPTLVLPLDADRHRTLHGREHTLQREAAFVVDLDLVATPNDPRVHDGRDLVVLRCEHEQPSQDPDLVRRETDFACLDYQHGHSLNEPAKVVVEVLDRFRLHAEHGIRVLANLRERALTSSLALDVELFDTYLSLHLGHQRAH